MFFKKKTLFTAYNSHFKSVGDNFQKDNKSYKIVTKGYFPTQKGDTFRVR